jgi:hypothetical protein
MLAILMTVAWVITGAEAIQAVNSPEAADRRQRLITSH